jgi:hypothetical protein
MSLNPPTAAEHNLPAVDTGNPSPSATPAKPRASRWRRYSLRALLLFQVVIAGFVGYVVWRVRVIERQHAAWHEINVPNIFNQKESPVQPEWFWGPVCRFCGCPTTDIVAINVQHHPLKVSEIERLPYLEKIDSHPGVESNAVMAILARSSRLKDLSFTNNLYKPITDEGLMQLRSNRSIERLYVHGKEFTDQAILALSEIPSVTSLNLEYTSATNLSLTAWTDKQHPLRHLHLPYRLSRQDVENLSKLTALEVLEVRDIDLDAADFLGKIPKLRGFHFMTGRISYQQREAAKRAPTHIFITDSHGKSLRDKQ